MSTTTSPDIVRDFPRVSADIVKRAAQFQPAILADVNGRRGALPA
jgi:4-hydroxy-4-methyl-2-oxoglutarate aldolase